MNSIFLFISTLVAAMTLAEGRYLLVEVPEDEGFGIPIATSRKIGREGEKISIYLLSNLGRNLTIKH